MIRALLTTARAFSAQPESMRDFAELTDADVCWLELASVPGQPVPLGIAELLRKAREKLDDPHVPALRAITANALPTAASASSETHRAALAAMVAGARR